MDTGSMLRLIIESRSLEIAPPNKSLDASGGSAVRIIIVRQCLIEFAPPRQLRRWASQMRIYFLDEP